ncbi:Coenzyme F420 hydrogenase/dehydrogenase, beta subunit C-terminal domain [Faecalicoccus pleomorphus]|uniref:Coenzyme F420 hydrogenase/dehydrogenase, beta subunit C-terminal domain n=1 Tax=Faecalicoccus pleomorphus TaxID=1323 RepID=UPI00242C1C8C|nr:Coenzyme F420 hydrogenase/dehydrogenase, beta subunit C-terminal domain [Faecalicoccus pleomorphus]
MNWNKPEVFAVQHKDEKVRASSRSGGIFTALSDYVLEQDGVVYGCVLTEGFEAVHVRADSTHVRERMRGSKYIQSRMNDTYKNVKYDLEAGRNVLFSGTSCQVAGLKGYLRREYENLLCIDIVCHGVPSPKVWKAYLAWQEKKNRSKVKKVDFRNKKDFGWREHIETLYLSNGQTVNSKAFTTLFYGHSILRPCCYECPYKSVTHPGDITIADYWGIEKAAPEFDDNKGVSLTLINNEKGKEFFDAIKDQVKCKETRLEDSMQPPLIAPFPEPENRMNFWVDFENRNFDYIVKKYGGKGIKNKIKNALRRIKRKLIK